MIFPSAPLLPSSPLLGAFLLASVVLAVTPGPGVVYIVARTLAQGRRAGLASVAGVALGNLGNALGAAIGLAALFAVSSWAFTVVRFAGAAYLVWLGWQALRAPAVIPDIDTAPRRADTRRIFRDGFVVALLNPKTALFFAAFLPQFIDHAAPALQQTVALGALFVLIAAATDTAYALAAGRIARWLSSRQRSGRPARWAGWLTASTFVGLGVFTAATGSPTAAK